MDGTDVGDHIRVSSTPTHAFRKWPLKLFFCALLPLIESNAFILHKNYNNERAASSVLTHREFRDTLILSLLKYRPKISTLTAGSHKRRRSSAAKSHHNEKKKAKLNVAIGNHIYRLREDREANGRRKRRRCSICSTRSSTSLTVMTCSSCQVGLCSLICFDRFHDEKQMLKGSWKHKVKQSEQ